MGHFDRHPILTVVHDLVGQGSSKVKRPSFVVLLGEGQGWGSTSVQMDERNPESKSSHLRAPNLEQLARQGMRFANFYAASPHCTPSHASLLTGKSPTQLHMTCAAEEEGDQDGKPERRVITPLAAMDLPASEVTTPKLLRRAGYATAHFGKWHFGRARPRQYGFEESDAPTNNHFSEMEKTLHHRGPFRMTERALEFMARQVSTGRPFYLQLSHYTSCGEIDASAETSGTARSMDVHASRLEVGEATHAYDLDRALGSILWQLDVLGIAETTWVLFTSDHGSPGLNPPLAGGKGTVSEGGIRVPFIVRGPGIRAGACSYVRACGVDLLPTIAALAGLGEYLPEGLDGGNLEPVLTQGGAGVVHRKREEFVVHCPHYDADPFGPVSAILLGDYKLIREYETGAVKLFNLVRDPGERHDCARELPDKAWELNRRLTYNLITMNAQMPVPKLPPDATQPVNAPGLSEGRGKALTRWSSCLTLKL